MDKITKGWFDQGRIWVSTERGKALSRPLEAFPLLKDASDEQRARFTIGIDGDDLRWDELDEDIHISSFHETTEPETDNIIGNVFRRFPQLNVSEVARTIGINKSLLSSYIYGIKRPSEARARQILDAIRALGREMANI